MCRIEILGVPRTSTFQTKITSPSLTLKIRTRTQDITRTRQDYIRYQGNTSAQSHGNGKLVSSEIQRQPTILTKKTAEGGECARHSED